jgi:hypothetical protein
MTGAALAVLLVGGGFALLFVVLAIAAMMRPRSRHISMEPDESEEEK